MKDAVQELKDALEEFEFFRLPKVQKKTGLSKPRIYTLMREGKFPKAYKLGDRAVGWRSDEIRKWQHSRKQA